MAKTVTMLALVGFTINAEGEEPLVGHRNKPIKVPEDMVNQLKKDKLAGDMPKKKADNPTGTVKQAGTVADKVLEDAKVEAAKILDQAKGVLADVEKIKADAEAAAKK